MSEPVRTCLGCRRRLPRRSLQRLVVEDGRVRPDPAAARPGRGAWVCARTECAEATVRGQGRALRRALRAPTATVTLDAAGLRAAFTDRAAHQLSPPDASRGART